MFGILLLIIIATTIWVGYDSSLNKISIDNKLYSLNNGAVAWVLSCILLWIVTFPYYLIKRSTVLQERQKEKGKIEGGEKTRLEAQEEIKKEAEAKRQAEDAKTKKVCLTVCLIALFISIIIVVMSLMLYGNKSKAPLKKERKIFNDRINKRIQSKPDDAEAHKDRGYAYLVKGNFDQAFFEYSKAIEINPKDGEAYAFRALNYFGKREYNKAWEDVHKAQSLGYTVDPQFIDNLNRKSNLPPENPTANTPPNISGNISLDGIFFDSNGKNLAIINGKIYHESDSIGNAKIERINKDSIDIIVDAQKKNVKVGQGAE